MKEFKEILMKIACLAAACISIIAVALICIFLFANGLPAIGKIGVFSFLFGDKWLPSKELFGILPMIIGSIYVTAGCNHCRCPYWDFMCHLSCKVLS